MDFLQLAKERFSCRGFLDTMITEEQLATILEAGRIAPTAMNYQEQRIYVARSPKAIDLVDEVTGCRYGAPVVLIVAYDEDTMCRYLNPQYSCGIEDATIVATHMMLAAKSVGVDSCYLNYFDPEEVQEKFGLPENEKVVMLLDLGYAADGISPAQKHFDNKPLTETVEYLFEK